MNMADITSEQIQIFLLVFVRITAIVSLLPIFGSTNVPHQIKAGFSFLFAIILFPLLSVEPDVMQISNISSFIIMVLREVLIGVTIGYATTMLFAAVQFAGRLMDTQMGFALVQVIDPFSNTQGTVTGQLQVIIFSIIFLLINGHYFLLLAIQKSFTIIPLFSMHFEAGPIALHLVTMVGQIFSLALRFAAPVFSVLVLSSLSLGIVARTVPQLNIFFVGLPMKIGVGLTTLVIVLPALVLIFKNMAEGLIQDIYKLLYLMV